MDKVLKEALESTAYWCNKEIERDLEDEETERKAIEIATRLLAQMSVQGLVRLGYTYTQIRDELKKKHRISVTSKTIHMDHEAKHTPNLARAVALNKMYEKALRG